MMAKIHRKSKGTSEVNLSSSSDIAFLLIIFFMVTSAFLFKDGLHLTLPKENSKPKVVKKDDIASITVRADEKLLLNDKSIKKADLQKELETRLEEKGDLIVLLRIEEKTKYQQVVSIVDIAKLVGAKKLSLKMIGSGG